MEIHMMSVFPGKKLKLSILEACKFLQDNGVGEIFINSIDNDGSKKVLMKIF